jgi:protein farnesyltransferase subunit beta
VEGGFNGRTNKLVDGCYSFWQGGAFPLMALSVGALLRAMPTMTTTTAGPAAAEAGAAGAGAVGVEAGAAGAAAGAAGGSGGTQGIPACTLFPTVVVAAAAAGAGDAGASSSTFTPFDPSTPPFSSRALQGWLLLCCQLSNGGLQDKPGKGRDHYHTCYCLSGLSTAQHWGRDGLVVGLYKLNPVGPIA